MVETWNLSVFLGGSEILRYIMFFFSCWVVVTSLECIWVTLLAVGLCAIADVWVPESSAVVDFFCISFKKLQLMYVIIKIWYNMSGLITDWYQYSHSLKSTNSYAANVELLLPDKWELAQYITSADSVQWLHVWAGQWGAGSYSFHVSNSVSKGLHQHHLRYKAWPDFLLWLNCMLVMLTFVFFRNSHEQTICKLWCRGHKPTHALRYKDSEDWFETLQNHFKLSNHNAIFFYPCHNNDGC